MTLALAGLTLGTGRGGGARSTAAVATARALAALTLVGAHVVDAIAEVIVGIVQEFFRITIAWLLGDGLAGLSSSLVLARVIAITAVATITRAILAFALGLGTGLLTSGGLALPLILALAFAARRLVGLLLAILLRLAARFARGAHFRLLRRNGLGIEALHVTVRDALLGQALDGLEQLLLVRRHQRDGLAIASGPAGTADAVYIVFLDIGQLEVDHVGQLIDVQAAGGDVGGDQHANVVALEVGQGLGAGVLALVAMDRRRRQAMLVQVLGQAIGAVLGTGEHQDLFPGAEGDQVGEQGALLIGRNAEQSLLDTLDGGVRRGDLDPLGILQQLAGEVGDVLGEGGREQQVLALRWQTGQDLLHVMDKAHVEHAVSFVQYQDFDGGQVDALLTGEVQQATRAGHENVHTLGQGGNLRLEADATEDAGTAHGQVAGIDPEAFVDLGRQFACGGQDQHPRLLGDIATAIGMTIGEQALEHRQREAAGLAGTGLGSHHQIATLQDGRDGTLLNRRGIRIASVFHGAGKGLGETEGNEGHAGFLSLSASRRRGGAVALPVDVRKVSDVSPTLVILRWMKSRAMTGSGNHDWVKSPPVRVADFKSRDFARWRCKAPLGSGYRSAHRVPRLRAVARRGRS